MARICSSFVLSLVKSSISTKRLHCEAILLIVLCILSVSQLMDQTRGCLYLVHVILLLAYGTHESLVELCAHFMVTREMLMLSSSFLMGIDLEQAPTMELADCLILGLDTSSKYTISSMLIMMFLMWSPFHFPYPADFFLLDTRTVIAMYGTPYWQRYWQLIAVYTYWHGYMLETWIKDALLLENNGCLGSFWVNSNQACLEDNAYIDSASFFFSQSYKNNKEDYTSFYFPNKLSLFKHFRFAGT